MHKFQPSLSDFLTFSFYFYKSVILNNFYLNINYIRHIFILHLNLNLLLQIANYPKKKKKLKTLKKKELKI